MAWVSHISMSSPGTGPLHSKWHETCTGIPLCAWCEHFAKTRNWQAQAVVALKASQSFVYKESRSTYHVCVSVCVCLSVCAGVFGCVGGLVCLWVSVWGSAVFVWVCGGVFGCGLVFEFFYLVSNLFVFFDNVWERNISYHNLSYGIIADVELSSLLMMSYHNLVMKSFERLWQVMSQNRDYVREVCDPMHLNFVKTLTHEKTHQSSIFLHELSQLKMRQDTIQITWDQETKRQRKREREQETERERKREKERETKRKRQMEKSKVPPHSIPLFVTQPNIILHSSSKLHVHTAFSLWSRVHGPWAIACLANCCVCGCLCVSVGVAVCQLVSCFYMFLLTCVTEHSVP